MKLIKVLILVFAIAGLSSAFIPSDGHMMFTGLLHEPKELLFFLAVFVPGLIGGAVALGTRPSPTWPAVLALAGFAFGFVHGHMWQLFSNLSMLPHLPIQLLLVYVGVIGGVLVSIIAVVKPDPTA
ncbi:MAG TPA: hypothetical protein VGM90_28210 [Kofleriaceae bacterium]|jgi:hypothetical protein